MEVFFQRYFWVLNLMVVALAGLVAGRTVSSVAEARLAQAAVTPPPKRAHRSGSSIRRTLDPKALASIFGMTLPEDLAAPVETGPASGEEVASTLNATLVATIVADPSELSLAIITDNGARETAVYGIGDLIQSAKVIQIEERRVLVLNGGRTEVLEMDGAGPKKGSHLAAVSARRNNHKEDTGSGIRKVSENEYVISQEEIEKTLSNLNTIATQARIVPAFKNGVSQGFKLFSIRPGSLYAKIGVQNGDIIKRVNGYEMNSPDKALEVYQKLKDAREISVEIERRGRTVKKSYSIE